MPPCTHQMVRLLYIREGNLRQKYGIELAAVIVVNTASAVPEILCRNGGAAHHGLHKTIIHEFFGSVCLRVKARKVGPEKEKGEKQHFFHHQEVDFRRMDAYLKASENPRSQDQYTDCDQADRCGKRNQSEASKSKYSKTGNNDAKHFRKHPSPVMKPRKQRCGSRINPIPSTRVISHHFRNETLSVPRSGVVASTSNTSRMPETVVFLLIFNYLPLSLCRHDVFLPSHRLQDTRRRWSSYRSARRSEGSP